jgi:hypothetical protein
MADLPVCIVIARLPCVSVAIAGCCCPFAARLSDRRVHTHHTSDHVMAERVEYTQSLCERRRRSRSHSRVALGRSRLLQDPAQISRPCTRKSSQRDHSQVMTKCVTLDL